MSCMNGNSLHLARLHESLLQKVLVFALYRGQWRHKMKFYVNFTLAHLGAPLMATCGGVCVRPNIYG